MQSHLYKIILIIFLVSLFIGIPLITLAHETGHSYVEINDVPTKLNIVHAFGHNPGFTLATDLAPIDSYPAGSPITFKINKENYYTPENAPAVFRWNFQDGTPPVDGDEVIHTFNSQGSYFVNIHARYNSDNPYTIIDTVQINIITSKKNQLPIAKIMVDGKLITDFDIKNEIPLNKKIEFNASQSLGSNLRYYWEFGDNTRSRDKIVSHVYKGDGESTYFPVLRVSDEQNIVHDSIITLVSHSVKPSPTLNPFIGFFQQIWNAIVNIFSRK